MEYLEKDNKSNSSLHSGHRDRMRDRFIATAGKGVSDHELLEMLLFCSIPRKNTNDIAHNLIGRFGSLQGVFDAGIDDLKSVEGVGKNTAVFIKNFIAVVEMYNNRDNKRAVITSTEDCGEFLLERYGDTTKEIVSAICLDERCNVIQWKVLCEGGIQSASFNVKKLISAVVDTDTTSVVLAHNHPFGVALPSKDDIASTIVLREALKHINIVLLDHIVIADNDYISMANSKLYKHIFTE